MPYQCPFEDVVMVVHFLHIDMNYLYVIRWDVYRISIDSCGGKSLQGISDVLHVLNHGGGNNEGQV